MFKDWREILVFGDNRIYTMLLIVRGKDNYGLKSEDLMIPRALYKEKHIEKYFKELKAIGDAYNKKYNIYIGYNPRNLLKAYNTLKELITKWDYELINNNQNINTLNHLKKIDKLFYRCLQKKGNHFSKDYFLIDLDTVDTAMVAVLEDWIKILKIEICYKTRTRNGYHFLVKKFDTRLFEDLKLNCGTYLDELKTDAMLQVYFSSEEVSISN
jgi:hypothetical protein